MSNKQLFTNLSLDELKGLIQDCVAEGIKTVPVQVNEPSDLIKTKEACDLLKVTKPTLYNWMNDNIITGYYLGTRLFFKKSELLESLKVKVDGNGEDKSFINR